MLDPGWFLYRFMANIPFSPVRVTIRINVKLAIERDFRRWCTWQDDVRTVLQEDMQIPTYDIPL